MYINGVNGINGKLFLQMLDSMYDELIIWDHNYKVAYVNSACWRHYACGPSDLIGKDFFDLINENWWSPSILPTIYEKKKPYAIKQKTHTDVELLTIGVPILDELGNIMYVVMNVRDKINERDLYNANMDITSVYSEDFSGLPILRSGVAKRLMKEIGKALTLPANILIEGEKGVGKTFYANYIHSKGIAAGAAMHTVFCSPFIEADKLVSEIETFVKNSKGKICQILLKHVSDLSLPIQLTLLELLRKLSPSNDKEKKILFISTSSRNIPALIEKEQFREELYYELNTVQIYIAPLRNRVEDFPDFVHHFLNLACSKYGVSRTITSDAIDILNKAEWRGNMRELKHVIDRLVVSSDYFEIAVENLPLYFFGISDEQRVDEKKERENMKSLDEKMAWFESFIIKESYQQHRSSRALASALQISQTRANKLIQKHILKENMDV